MKKRVSGIVTNLSNNPFHAITGRRIRTSTTLSFDLSFDLCDEGGNVTHVWFFRSFKLPPPLQNGDQIEVVGKFGRLLGMIGKKNLYATRILDRRRGVIYTQWRDIPMERDELRDLSVGEET